MTSKRGKSWPEMMAASDGKWLVYFRWPVVLLATIVAGWIYGYASFPAREAHRWDGCIGKEIVQCRAPSGYGAIETGKIYFLTSIDPTGQKYAFAQLKRSEPQFWSHAIYAVIELDTNRRIVNVEVQRIYAPL